MDNWLNNIRKNLDNLLLQWNGEVLFLKKNSEKFLNTIVTTTTWITLQNWVIEIPTHNRRENIKIVDWIFSETLPKYLGKFSRKLESIYDWISSLPIESQLRQIISLCLKLQDWESKYANVIYQIKEDQIWALVANRTHEIREYVKENYPIVDYRNHSYQLPFWNESPIWLEWEKCHQLELKEDDIEIKQLWLESDRISEIIIWEKDLVLNDLLIRISWSLKWKHKDVKLIKDISQLEESFEQLRWDPKDYDTYIKKLVFDNYDIFGLIVYAIQDLSLSSTHKFGEKNVDLPIYINYDHSQLVWKSYQEVRSNITEIIGISSVSFDHLVNQIAEWKVKMKWIRKKIHQAKKNSIIDSRTAESSEQDIGKVEWAEKAEIPFTINLRTWFDIKWNNEFKHYVEEVFERKKGYNQEFLISLRVVIQRDIRKQILHKSRIKSTPEEHKTTKYLYNYLFGDKWFWNNYRISDEERLMVILHEWVDWIWKILKHLVNNQYDEARNMINRSTVDEDDINEMNVEVKIPTVYELEIMFAQEFYPSDLVTELFEHRNWTFDKEQIREEQIQSRKWVCTSEMIPYDLQEHIMTTLDSHDSFEDEKHFYRDIVRSRESFK